MIRLRATAPADLPALAELFLRSFGHPLSAAEWEWKYRRLPGEGRSAVAVDGGGRVLAHAGALRLEARWSGGEGGIWQLADFAGSPGGHGLRPPLVELGRWLLADLPGAGEAPWIFGFPSRRHFRLGQRVFGYLPLARWRELAGELTPVAEAARAAGTDRLPAAPTDRPWKGAESVWEACGVQGVRRSEAFLAWRYWSRPDRYYRFYRLSGGGAEGLAVFAFVGAEARAAELWLPPGGHWRGALGAVAADLHRSGLRRWRFWPPAGGGEEALRDLGLAPGEEVFAGCRGAVGAPDPRPAAAGFHYAMGDYDVT
jgi:hypothetical protein